MLTLMTEYDKKSCMIEGTLMAAVTEAVIRLRRIKNSNHDDYLRPLIAELLEKMEKAEKVFQDDEEVK